MRVCVCVCVNLPFQNDDPHYWTRGVAHLLLATTNVPHPLSSNGDRHFEMVNLSNYPSFNLSCVCFS